VLLMKREPSVDENVAKRIVDAALDTWAGGLLGALRSRHAAVPAVSDSSSIDPLLPTLVNLRHCSPERREEFVDQLLSDCENNGIHFPSLPPHEVTASGYRVVRWKDELDLEFDRFGEIGPGDKALILRGPIERNGQLHKGLVKRHTGT
jgi:hypothetical protein